METFGINIFGEGGLTVDYLDMSAFDEKFEIELAKDYIQNIYHVENKYHVPVLSGSFRDMYEYCRANLVPPEDHAFEELMNPDTLEARLAQSEMPGVIKASFRLKLVDGAYRWVQYVGISGEAHGVPKDKVYFYVYDIQNQHDRLAGKTTVSPVDAVRDELTGLRLREAFLPLARAQKDKLGGTWCCLAIDIQHFKIFNNWFGYEAGDYLLSRIGSYLQQMEQNEQAVAAYYGRDNFAVFLRFGTERINKLYQDVKDIVNAYSKVAGFLPALGIYVPEEGTALGLDMYDKARLAVEDAKKTYTDRIRFFDSQAYGMTRRNHELLTEFQHALANQEIIFFVQPQCHIATGRIIGAEALARWVKPDGTIINPGSFVPFLETSGFITELDKAVWNAVCKWIRSMIDRQMTPVPVSVNVSQVDLLSMDVAAYLYALTELHNIPPRLIKVEITESAYAENYAGISKTIAELKQRGFSVFLDDFGAGYSSLNMLDKINVDVLKLDMAFMRKDTSMTRKGISIVESILSMTKVLDMPVVVEGVESEEQIAFLRQMGCRYAQGYYFYRPMNLQAYEQLLADPDNVDHAGYKVRSTDLFHAREFLNESMFTDSALNQILGPVAFYMLTGRDLTISRFNEPFYRAIGDANMDGRRTAIQHYVVEEDRPMMYEALETAEREVNEGGRCEVRFYKSDNSVFWFRMHFFFLKEEPEGKLFYGQIEDVTELREQSIRFLEVLRSQSDVTMRLDLDRNNIQYITGNSTLYQVDLPSMRLDLSIRQTSEKRIAKEEDRKAFIHFFDLERLREAYRKAIYHEVLNIEFKLWDEYKPVEFSTYYIRHSKSEGLIVYAFAKLCERELLEHDPLTGMPNRYAYHEMEQACMNHRKSVKDMIVFSMDVNSLKSTNDRLGHLAGDELIRGAADCMTAVFSPYGSCYRVGGDEFIAIVYGDKGLADSLVNKLDYVTSEWRGKMVSTLSVSCGYAVSEDCPGMNLVEMVRLADQEMYRSKSRYYQRMGVDRRLQQDAFNVLCNSYKKILKVNLTEDRFEIIRAEADELVQQRGFNERISAWLHDFALTNQVHPDDQLQYLQQTDIAYLSSFFAQGNKSFSLKYRRMQNGCFGTAVMEIIRASEYRDDNQWAYLYVKSYEE